MGRFMTPSEIPSEEQQQPQIDVNSEADGRRSVLLIGGFIVLGLALTLIIFGQSLFGMEEDGRTNDGQPAAGSSVLEQVPSFEEAGSGVASLPQGSGPLEIGAPAYDFSLNDLDGNSIRLSDLEGRPVIINFWATWCAPCLVEMPELQAAYERYQDNDLAILALNQQEPPEIVREFFYGQLGLTFTPLLDAEGDISELYGVANILPTTFFITPDGKVAAIHRGPMVQSQIDGYLADTLSGG